jgi:hypothetical protein
LSGKKTRRKFLWWMASKVEVVSVRLIDCGIHFFAVYWEPLGLISHLYLPKEK